jgi:hypothetical protein
MNHVNAFQTNGLPKSRYPAGRGRRGISLFEVLISILVASIGVFGVLVLIPFAIRNAQLGIDREFGINSAKNFNSDFQAYGYQNTAGWHDDTADVQVTAPVAPAVAQPAPLATPNNIQGGWPYVIDPTWAISNDLSALAAYGQFPSVGGLPADFPRLNIANLMQPGTATPMNIPFARRMTLQPDGLVFDPPLRELEAPRQKYFAVEGDPVAKRQLEGRYASMAFVVPDDDFGRQYRMYTMVRRQEDRISERVFEIIDPDPLLINQAPANMRILRLDTGAPGRQMEQIGLGGGDFRLSEITPVNPAVTDGDQIRANDWLMLISYQRTAAIEPTFDDIQISFYRVVHASRTSPDPDAGIVVPQGANRGGGAERTFNVTVQGPDFDLYRDWNSRIDGQRTEAPTYAILLPGVLTVYERTFRTEPASTWQNQ